MPFLTTLYSKLPKKRWLRVLLYSASTFFILLAADMSLTAYWRRITISPQITFITAPLHPDGTPDYLAWLDQRTAQGITPEDNAAIPLLQATGLNAPNAQWENAFLTKLGTPGEKLPGKLTRYYAWMATHPNAHSATAPSATSSPVDAKVFIDQEEQFSRRPWTDAEFPDAARWLDSQHEVSALAHQAAARDRYYTPLISRSPQHQPGDAAMIILPHLSNLRYLSRMLDAQALRHAHDADKTVFIRNLADAFKLGSLLSRQPTIVEHLISMAIWRDGQEALRTTLDGLSPADDRSLLAAISTLPPVSDPDLYGERCLFLDLCCQQAAIGLGHSQLGASAQPKAAALISLGWPVHFNGVMADINSTFDRLEEERHIGSFQKRVEAVAATEKNLYTGTARTILMFSGMLFTQGGDHGWFESALKADQEIRVRRELIRLALALAIYHSDKGSYPPTLDVLAGPKGILDGVPLDGFTDQPFVYRATGNGYTLYSVGPDFQDDNGDAGKDLVIRSER